MCGDNKLSEIQKKIPGVPLDGLAVAGLVYILSPSSQKIRNTMIIGGAHYVIHKMICCSGN